MYKIDGMKFLFALIKSVLLRRHIAIVNTMPIIFHFFEENWAVNNIHVLLGYYGDFRDPDGRYSEYQVTATKASCLFMSQPVTDENGLMDWM